MSFSIRAVVEIDAPVSTTWRVLVDVGAWPEWCSWLRHEGGVFAEGERVRLRLTPPEGGGYAFEPEVLVVEPPTHLAWVGRTGLPGVFDGEHHFVLSETEDGGTLLENRERYSGLLSPLMKRIPQMKNADEGFAAINAEIKARAEALARGA